MTIPHNELPSPFSHIHVSGNTASRAKIFRFIPLASRRLNPVSRQQSLRILDFCASFESNPGSRDQSTLRTNEKNKEKHKQRNNQSKATYTNFYLFFLLFFVIAFGRATSLSRKPADFKNVTSPNYSAKMSFAVYHVTAGNSKTLKSVSAYFSFHRHWFSLQWDVADKTFRYFLPNSDLFYLPVVRTDKC